MMRTDWEICAAWRTMVKAVLERDGYLVNGSPYRLKIGSIATSGMPEFDREMPMRVIAEASYDDAVRQLTLTATIASKDDDMVVPPRNYFFYKTVVAD